MTRQVRRGRQQQRDGAQSGHGQRGEPYPPYAVDDRGGRAVGHGQPGPLQPVGEAAYRVRRRRGGPHRGDEGLPLRPDDPYHRPFHVVPSERIDHGRPAGAGQQQPALTRHRDQGDVGDPPGAAGQERRLVQRQITSPAPGRAHVVDGRSADGGQAQPCAGDAGDGP
ncbi:hypothetical protein SHIRM173S_04762 [Streptomyces hirsutus]